MPKIVVGYGPHSGWLLAEIPDDVLRELARRYPLEITKSSLPDYDALMATVAVHGELQRRASNGKVHRHYPSERELAEDIIKRGFQQASKIHHPDVGGAKESQQKLAAVRDRLLRKSKEFPSFDQSAATLVIMEDALTRSGPWEPSAYEISDDDIPF